MGAISDKGAMNLQLLDFDCSEDAEGVVCWDALAQPAPHYNSALLAEVAQVLAWCHRFDARGPGSLEDGANWDFDLQVTLQGGAHPGLPLPAKFEPTTGALHLPLGADQQAMALSLSISGSPGFGQAFRDQFGV